MVEKVASLTTPQGENVELAQASLEAAAGADELATSLDHLQLLLLHQQQDREMAYSCRVALEKLEEAAKQLQDRKGCETTMARATDAFKEQLRQLRAQQAGLGLKDGLELQGQLHEAGSVLAKSAVLLEPCAMLELLPEVDMEHGQEQRAGPCEPLSKRAVPEQMRGNPVRISSQLGSLSAGVSSSPPRTQLRLSEAAAGLHSECWRANRAAAFVGHGGLPKEVEPGRVIAKEEEEDEDCTERVLLFGVEDYITMEKPLLEALGPSTRIDDIFDGGKEGAAAAQIAPFPSGFFVLRCKAPSQRPLFGDGMDLGATLGPQVPKESATLSEKLAPQLHQPLPVVCPPMHSAASGPALAGRRPLEEERAVQGPCSDGCACKAADQGPQHWPKQAGCVGPLLQY